MRIKLTVAQSDAEGNRFELIARDSVMEKLTDRLSDATGGKVNAGVELQEAIKDLSVAKSQVTVGKRKFDDLQSRYVRTQKLLTQNEQSLESRERELSDIRSTNGQDEASHSELTRQLIDEKSHNVEITAKLAQINLQMEALLNDASNENVEAAMGSIKMDKKRLEEELQEMGEERDKLSESLLAYQRDKAEDWDSERRENSILRERINDLAAQVTSMTASIEGENSPIHQILAKAKPARKAAGGKTNGSSSRATNTLADRIRALQETARAVNK